MYYLEPIIHFDIISEGRINLMVREIIKVSLSVYPLISLD